MKQAAQILMPPSNCFTGIYLSRLLQPVKPGVSAGFLRGTREFHRPLHCEFL